MKKSLVRAAAYPALGATKVAILAYHYWFPLLLVAAFLFAGQKLVSDGALRSVQLAKTQAVHSEYVEPKSGALLHEGLAQYDAQKVTDSASPETNMANLAYNTMALESLKDNGLALTRADFYATAPGPDGTTYAFYVIHISTPDGERSVWEVLTLDKDGLVLKVE